MAKQDKADWYKLLQISIKKLKNIFVLGGEFCTTFIQNSLLQPSHVIKCFMVQQSNI